MKLSPSTLTKPALLSLPLAALCSTSASAQTVIPVNLSINSSELTHHLYVDLDTQTSWVAASTENSTADIYFSYTNQFSSKPNAFSPSVTPQTSGLHLIVDSGTSNLTSFNVGDVISSAGTSTKETSLTLVPGTHYFGFTYTSSGQNPENLYGYGEYTLGLNLDLHVSHIAFDSNPITVAASSVIPEPSTYAAAAGLLAGSAALLRRRQQRKAALAAA